MDAAQDAIIVRDLADRIVFWNRGAQLLYGWTRRETLGIPSRDLFKPRALGGETASKDALAAHGVWEGVVHHRTRDRGEVGIWSRWNWIRDRSGEVQSILQVDRNITDMLGLIDAARDAVLLTTEDLRVVLINSAAEQLLGVDAGAGVGLTVDRLNPSGALADRIRSAVSVERRGHEIVRRPIEIAVRRANGSELPAEAIVTRHDIVGQHFYAVSLRDISDRRLLETQFRQSQRMEAIGRLSGGIAHDFNNLICAITGHVEFVRPVVTDQTALSDLDAVKQAADRAAQLARQLLIFSRSQVLRPRVVHPNDAVAAVETLLRRAIGEDVRLETNLDTEVPLVRIDPAQLEQALLDLAVNARDAMPNGGTLTISTRPGTLPPRGARGERQAAIIEVADTGVGMDATTREHAFEPFFTTKDPNRGTGLGLPAVYGIATAADGELTIDSAPEAGTRVVIALPAADDSDLDDDLTRARTVSAAGAGGKRLLLVEDEEVLRSVARRLLQGAGHVIVEARTGREALTRWNEAVESGRPIDAVVTDVVMPDMGGRELVAKLRARHPELPVVYVSGYLEDAIAGLDLSPPARLVEKPFTAASLNDAVQAVLAISAAL